MAAPMHIAFEPSLAELKPMLIKHVEQLLAGLQVEHFSVWLDPLMRDVLARGFAEAGADEGTVWLVDSAEQHLAAAYNTGPNAAKLVGPFRQPLNAGLVSMVLASEQSFVENEVYRNSRHSRLLDTLLGVQTYALIAVPFFLLHRCRGVLSCVQFRPADPSQPDPAGFGPAHLAAVERAANVLSRLIESRLLSSLLD